jgi:hypothetical protein
MDNLENIIFSVSDNDDGQYVVNVGKGTSVEEVAFGISVIIKCFNRDEIISKEDFLDLIDKYLTDVQYNEVVS